MKKNLKQALVPLAVMVFGAAAAFTTNAVKQSEKQSAIMVAYHYDISKPSGQRCVAVTVDDCTPMTTSQICTDAFNRQVWESPIENGLQCSLQLYKL